MISSSAARGGDTLDGGDGIDTASYQTSSNAVTVSVDPKEQQLGVNARGNAQGDTLANIENLAGSNNAEQQDRLFGDDGPNVISGLDGPDALFGRPGDDTLSGGNGSDQLFGEADDDTLIGGAGADVLDGGDGVDMASYRTSSEAVTVSVDPEEQQLGVNARGDAQGDTFGQHREPGGVRQR